MARYALYIEFEGTRYSGWQIQPNATTVEGTLEEAMSRILQEEIDVIGQGRTDAGVHAAHQIAHVDINQSVDINKLLYALLGVLPRDICVWKMIPVADEFHARFDAGSRSYCYRIVTRPSALQHNFAAYVHRPLDISSMMRCAKLIAGEHDFESFSKADKDQAHARCTVTKSLLEQQDYAVSYHISANRFVRNMVRRLVGSLIRVGTGRLSEAAFHQYLHQPSVETSTHSAPAKGLTLVNVAYEAV